jgi:hypothetical protein
MLEISFPRPRAYGRCLPCKWHSHSWLCSVHRPASPHAAQKFPASAKALPPRHGFPQPPLLVVLININRTGFTDRTCLPSALAIIHPGSARMGASNLVPPRQNQPPPDSAPSSRGPCASKFIAPATPLECALAQKGWGGTPRSSPRTSSLRTSWTSGASQHQEVIASISPMFTSTATARVMSPIDSTRREIPFFRTRIPSIPVSAPRVIRTRWPARNTGCGWSLQS